MRIAIRNSSGMTMPMPSSISIKPTSQTAVGYCAVHVHKLATSLIGCVILMTPANRSALARLACASHNAILMVRCLLVMLISSCYQQGVYAKVLENFSQGKMYTMMISAKAIINGDIGA